MPSSSSITDQISPGECLRRLASVVKGRSFGVSEMAKDRMSGRSLLDVMNLIARRSEATGSTDDTAEELAVMYSLRVVRRVLAYLRAEGLVIEQTFRRNHSPRVERSIDWQQLAEWIERNAIPETKERRHENQPRRPAAARPQKIRMQQEIRTHSPEPRRRADTIPSIPPQKQPVVQASVPVRTAVLQSTEHEAASVALKEQLSALGVSPTAIDQAAVSLETVRRLVEHYIDSQLLRVDGTSCYAWSPGLLFKRITDDALAFRSPGDWPPSKDEEWKRLKAKAVSEARQAREAAVRQQCPEIDKRQRLHQLEMRFADLLKDPAFIVDRLLQIPEPNSYLIKHIRTNGISSDNMRLLVLSTIERHETGA